MFPFFRRKLQTTLTPLLSFQILTGNKDQNTVVGHILNPPIVARYIRIYPKEYQSYMALRFELFGCTVGLIAVKSIHLLALVIC